MKIIDYTVTEIILLIVQLAIAYIGWQITAQTIMQSWLNNIGLILIFIAVLFDEFVKTIIYFRKKIKTKRGKGKNEI